MPQQKVQGWGGTINYEEIPLTSMSCIKDQQRKQITSLNKVFFKTSEKKLKKNLFSSFNTITTRKSIIDPNSFNNSPSQSYQFFFNTSKITDDYQKQNEFDQDLYFDKVKNLNCKFSPTGSSSKFSTHSKSILQLDDKQIKDFPDLFNNNLLKRINKNAAKQSKHHTRLTINQCKIQYQPQRNKNATLHEIRQYSNDINHGNKRQPNYKTSCNTPKPSLKKVTPKSYSSGKNIFKKIEKNIFNHISSEKQNDLNQTKKSKFINKSLVTYLGEDDKPHRSKTPVQGRTFKIKQIKSKNSKQKIKLLNLKQKALNRFGEKSVNNFFYFNKLIQ